MAKVRANPAPPSALPPQEQPAAPRKAKRAKQADAGQQPHEAQAAQMQRPRQPEPPARVMLDDDVRDLSPDEQNLIRQVAAQRGAIQYDEHNLPFIEVYSADTAQRALARYQTAFHKPLKGPNGNPLTADTNAVRDLVVIKNFKVERDENGNVRCDQQGRPILVVKRDEKGSVQYDQQGQPIYEQNNILLQMPTAKVDSIKRNAISGAIWALSAYAPVTGAWFQTAAGAVAMMYGARIALNPDRRSEGLATMAMGAKHFAWGAFSTVANWLTYGTFSAVTTVVGYAAAALDAGHAVGHVATNPTPVVIEPAGAGTRALANVMSTGDWISDGLVWAKRKLGGLFHKKQAQVTAAPVQPQMPQNAGQ